MAERKKSDLSRAFSEDGARKTHVGGQALIEGIMMRGKFNWAVAVREPDDGIYTESHDLASGKPKNGWMNAPLARGCRALVESLVIGFKALEIAANHAFPEDEEEGSGDDGRAEGGASVADDQAPAPSSDGEPTRGPMPVAADGGARGADDAADEAADGDGEACRRPFSWKDDFGRPEEAVDALGAQRGLEVVTEPAAPGAKPARATEERGGSATPAGAAAPAAKDAKPSGGKGEADAGDGFGKSAMAVSMVFGIVIGIVLFIVAPAAITNLIVGEYGERTLVWNIVDGVLRVAVFIFYIWLIGRMSDIKRMFGYHGAEHKTIHCYEHGLPLTPENARSFPRLHVRCGTAFLIMVMIIAILVYTIVPINLLVEALGIPEGIPTLVVVILARIVLMPVIAGVSYEITVKWAGSHPDNPLVKVVLWPGMQMQYLTTREPDDGMIECAIAAMQIVLDREEAEAKRAERRARAKERAAARAKERAEAEPDAA